MAREVHDRENLLRDAVALSPRIQLRRRHDATQEVFAGFRGNCLSLYFNDDPVFHFNAAGNLRRAFVNDRLLKAERGRLVALRRVQSAEESRLMRTDMEPDLQRQLLSEAERRLGELAEALAASELIVVGQAPDDGSARQRLQDWLQQRRSISVATSPRVD